MIDDKLIEKVELSYSKVYEDLELMIKNPLFFNLRHEIDGYECTFNFEKAMQLYMEQDPENIYTSYPDLIGNPPTEVKYDEKIWESINTETELEIKKIREKYGQIKLWELVKQESMKNDWWHLGDVAGFVYNDFINIIEFYSYRIWSNDQIESIFIDSQYQVYKSGGFPYGWKGKYPRGKILVYIPMKVEKFKNLKQIELILNKINRNKFN